MNDDDDDDDDDEKVHELSRVVTWKCYDSNMINLLNQSPTIIWWIWLMLKVTLVSGMYV